MTHKLEEIKRREMGPFRVVCVRHVGPYAGDTELFGRLFGKLLAWAGPRGLLGTPEARLLTAYHDDPNTVAPQALRTSVCLTVAEGVEAEGDIEVMTLPAGAYAVGRFELGPQEFPQAWGEVVTHPLCREFPCQEEHPALEIYHNKCEEHPEKKSIVDICMPIA